MQYDKLLVLKNDLIKIIDALSQDPVANEDNLAQVQAKYCDVCNRIAILKEQMKGKYRSVPKTQAQQFKKALKHELLSQASSGKSIEMILNNAFVTKKLSNPGINLEKSIAILRENGYFSYVNPEDVNSSIEITEKAERFLANEASIRRK